MRHTKIKNKHRHDRRDKKGHMLHLPGHEITRYCFILNHTVKMMDKWLCSLAIHQLTSTWPFVPPRCVSLSQPADQQFTHTTNPRRQDLRDKQDFLRIMCWPGLMLLRDDLHHFITPRLLPQSFTGTDDGVSLIFISCSRLHLLFF